MDDKFLFVEAFFLKKNLKKNLNLTEVYIEGGILKITLL